MDFFDEPPPPPPPRPEQERVSPPWMGAPAGWIGAPTATVLELVETAEVAAFISSFVAFPSGLLFEVRLVSREPRRLAGPGGHPLLDVSMDTTEWEDGPPDSLVRFGVLLADGTKATNLRARFRDFHQAPDPPVLWPRGGGGTDRSWTTRFWLWPLPPEGAMTFVIEWPQYHIPETRASIDTSEFRLAAEQAKPIWGDS